MKIIGISDIHGEFRDLPKCEVICICGDIVGLNDQRAMDASRKWWYNRFTAWVNRLDCEKVIITPGNHDFFIEDAVKRGYFSELKQDLSVRTNGKLVMLVNEEYVYNGIKFYGCPYIQPISFQVGRWAFEDDAYNTNGDNCVYSSIPEDTDVLITHDSPIYNGKLEYCISSKTFTKPLYHLYGHWHDGASDPYIRRYNCSVLNDIYNHKKDFKYVEIEVMTEDEKTKIELEYLDLLRVTFDAYFRLKGETLTREDIQEFFNIQKRDLNIVAEEDTIPLPITGDIIMNAELEPIFVEKEDDDED